MKGKNSFRYNGFIHRKTVGVEPANAGIEPAKEGSGVLLVTRKSKSGCSLFSSYSAGSV